MKRVLMTGLLLCLSLALAAPALAGGDQTIIYPDQKGKKGHVIPLAPDKTLTWRLKPGMSGSTLKMDLEPTASGEFRQTGHGNAKLENCKSTYPYGASGVKIPVNCKMTVIDTSKEAWLKYQNDSKGIVQMHLE